jgi:hypothetical protein
MSITLSVTITTSCEHAFCMDLWKWNRINKYIYK